MEQSVSPGGAERGLALVERFLATVSQRTTWKAVWSARVPRLDDGAAGRCPRCTRHLPPFSLWEYSGGRGRWANASDLAQLCLVDGWRSQHAQPFTVEELVAASEGIAEGLTARRWNTWAVLCSTGPLRRTGAGNPAERVGQAFEVLRKFGPQHRTFGELTKNDPLEVLVASTGPYWPVASARH